MSQSCTGLFFHVILATKDRSPLLAPQIMRALRCILSESISELDGEMLAAGGMSDHVHVLIHLGPRLCLARFVDALKTESAARLNALPAGISTMAWQEGYLAFMVCSHETARVSEYIHRQQEHHLSMTYQEEILRLRKRDLRSEGARPWMM